MPIYEFQCKKCKHRFEKIQSFSAKPPKKCPECGGALEQLQHAPAIHFKGAGWYVTDYAGKGKDGGKKEEAAPAESKPESKAETKSESTDAGKSEKKPKKSHKG